MQTEVHHFQKMFLDQTEKSFDSKNNHSESKKIMFFSYRKNVHSNHTAIHIFSTEIPRTYFVKSQILLRCFDAFLWLFVSL